jgi:hypothetical protein
MGDQTKKCEIVGARGTYKGGGEKRNAYDIMVGKPEAKKTTLKTKIWMENLN